MILYYKYHLPVIQYLTEHWQRQRRKRGTNSEQESTRHKLLFSSIYCIFQRQYPKAELYMYSTVLVTLDEKRSNTLSCLLETEPSGVTDVTCWLVRFLLLSLDVLNKLLHCGLSEMSMNGLFRLLPVVPIKKQQHPCENESATGDGQDLPRFVRGRKALRDSALGRALLPLEMWPFG